MEKVSGRFYFKQTSNGNLIGEFSNDGTTRALTESADIITEFNKGDYTGEYNSTWYDDEACYAKLKISIKINKIFSLEWNGKYNFKGQGMLCDDILIGNYWGIEKDK